MGTSSRKTMGDALAEIRESQRMTQTDLSRRTGIPQRTISWYEAGGKVPPVTRALDLKRALRMSWTEFDYVFNLPASQKRLDGTQ